MNHTNLFSPSDENRKAAVFGQIDDLLTPYLISFDIFLTTVEEIVPQNIWEKDSVQNKILKLKPDWLDMDEKKFLGLVRYKSVDLSNLPRYHIHKSFFCIFLFFFECS